MEKPLQNIIMFDQEQPSITDHRQIKSYNNSKYIQAKEAHNQIQVIQSQLFSLQQKIKYLQNQTQQCISNSSELIDRRKNGENSNNNQQILLAIQKKIQIILRQSKNMIAKIQQNLENKLKLAKNIKNIDTIQSKIKEVYNTSLKKIQDNYRRQLQKIQKQFKDSQFKYLARVNSLQEKYRQKINNFQIKQKQYIDWIHHLQIQLKQKPLKSKRMIQITQQKVNNKKEILNTQNSVNTGIQNNYASINTFKSKELESLKSNQIKNQSSKLHNDSKIQRKHRIFDNNNQKSSSLSPNNKLNPNIIQNIYQKNYVQQSKVINPIQRSKIDNSLVDHNLPFTNRNTQPLKSSNLQNQSSPWKVMQKSIQKSYVDQSKRNPIIIKDVGQDEFYKDVPKPNHAWQNFQNFHEQDGSSLDSEQQVFFYKQETRLNKPDEIIQLDHVNKKQIIKNVFDQNKKYQKLPQKIPQSKVFSPFDLN